MPGRSRIALWTAFAGVHAWLTWLGVVVAPAAAFADLDLYRWWMHLGLDWSTWPVLDGPWVYPAGALAPMLLPALASTTSTTAYAVAWCLLVAALDAAATAALLRRAPGTRTSSAGAWWWLGYLVLLGPVAIGRLDGVVTPLMVLALLAGVRRPAVASVLVTVGAWIKAAPAALVLPLLFAARRPVRDVVMPAAATCLVVVGLVTAGGGLGHIASFAGAQGTRDLQVESVGATPWVLSRLWRGDVVVELDPELITWEVHGPGTVAAARVLDVLMVLAVAALLGALLFARLEGRAGEALLPGAFALVVVLVVTNKVGSPQFLAWLAAPVAVLLARPGASPRRWRRAVAGTALVAAALTQAVFPWRYGPFISGEALALATMAARNLALVVLLGLAVAGLAEVVADDGRRAGPGEAAREPSEPPRADLPADAPQET